MQKAFFFFFLLMWLLPLTSYPPTALTKATKTNSPRQYCQSSSLFAQ